MVTNDVIDGEKMFYSFSWYLRQLIPLTYESEYETNGQRFCAIWKMWFGRILWSRNFKVI